MPSQRPTREALSYPGVGFLVVVSAPSGGGKTTVLKRILERSEGTFCYSISATTRQPRVNEVDGRDYHFFSLEEFHRRIAANAFIEYAEVHGNMYGTPRQAVADWIQQGKIVLLDLDVQGGINVKEQLGEKALLIFIKPPTLETLRQRLLSRNTDSPAEITARLQAAEKELAFAQRYDQVIVNQNLDKTVDEVLTIIANYRTIPL